MPYQNQTLLQTKLHRPPITRSLIARPHLIEQLNSGINRPLTLVCAAAGYGKTTLVGSWLEGASSSQPAEANTLPAAWLSLDENDSNLQLFLQYFVAALRTIFTDACSETLALLHEMVQPPPIALYTTLNNEIEQLSGSFILVLDDYHTIHDVEVHGLFNEWARHWPKPLHLVLISRINPPVPLTRLRAKGEINEIRAQDLRFTLQETTEYLSRIIFAPLSRSALLHLEKRFEGWITGLRLAALSLRSIGSQESVLRALSSENTNITEYLMNEVLTIQVPAIQTFLLKTSILDRFCTSLCEATIGEVDAAWNVGACLEWIERSELFITPLDNHGEWYRYHHIFQELLQQRLIATVTPDQLISLHRQASAWFEEHGLLDEALHHALAAGDLDLAARQMNTGLRDALNRGEQAILERRLRLLPEEMIQRSPGLLMIKAWTLHFAWRLDLQSQVLQQIEDLLISMGDTALPADEVQILRGQTLLLRAQLAYFSNQTRQAINLCRQGLALVPPSWTFVRGGLMIYLGTSMQASGQALAAERLLLDEYEAYGDKTDAYALRLLLPLCFNFLNTGKLEQTRQIAQVLLQGAIRSRQAIMKNWGEYFLGVVCYQRNELEAAAQHFTQIAGNHYSAQVTTLRDAIAGLALCHQAKGESTKAWQMIESISRFDLERRGIEDDRTRSLRARLLLIQGDVEGADRWVEAFDAPPPDQPLMWLEEPQVTRVRILWARGSEADLQMALQILDTLEEIAKRTYNTRYKIEILALRALALDAAAQHAVAQRAAEKTSSANAAANAAANAEALAAETFAEANTALKLAVDLARVGGFIRVFVDLGKPMQEMLRQLTTQGYSVETIRRILAAFPEGDKKWGRSDIPAQPVRFPSLSNSTLAEPLTPRELEVLNLLREPLSIKEIALMLNISYATVKRHTINLYGKLGVNRRWDAVARGIELEALPSD